MKRVENKIVRRGGLAGLFSGLILMVLGFTGFASEILSQSYTIGLGIISFVIGSILYLLRMVSKRQSFFGSLSSFVVVIILLGIVFGLMKAQIYHETLILTLLITGLAGILSLVIFLSLYILKSVESSDETVDETDAWLLVFGEYHWEKYLFWSMGMLFIIIFSLSFIGIGEDYLIEWQDALIIGLLSLALGYLSDLRYRLFPEVRSD